MDPHTPSGAPPQFDVADYGAVTTADACSLCGGPKDSPYYHVNGEIACATCAEAARAILASDTAGVFVRALVFGFGAAIVGLILYAIVGIATGYAIGYVSLAVGYIVAKAMMKGSRGIGGRRYQVAAVALTYFAVSVAAVPIAIAQFAKNPEIAKAQTEQSQRADAAQEPRPQGQQMGLLRGLGFLLVIGLVSPFLALQDPGHGLIGLVILFVGLSIAWRTTAGRAILVEGPY